ncbi:hypothetical protein EYF80_059218 [Liparis tanakae]|uniref:Uncharacterized protein n=1 Tax=Liparis tanakae TaxID=230148 RepID=A0A4Z2EPD1_9TELE|nr:hypothetical protein EYF80_059218 [Liparis tanakae]
MSRQVVRLQPESKLQNGGCFALCCLPVFTCKVTRAVGSCACLPLLDCIGCVPPASLAMRASVRERYGIPVRQLR